MNSPSIPSTPSSAARSRRWLAISGAIGLVGIALSAYSAESVARRDTSALRNSFEQNAIEVANRVKLALHQQADLVINTGALVASDPAQTQAQFTTWIDSARVADRYPEVLGLGLVVTVRAEALSTFVGLHTTADGTLVTGLVGDIEPAGERDTYCLSKLGFVRSADISPPAHDWCAGDALAVSANTAQTTSEPVVVDGRTLLTVNVPVYSGGIVPTSVGTRRKTFIGWVGTLSDPQVILANALDQNDRLSLSMWFGTARPAVTFDSGVAPAHAWTSTVDLVDGWVVTVSGEPAATSVIGDRIALGFLLIGTGLSIVLAAFVHVLGSGRGRAIRLVSARTGELRHQALHDQLTGLPNRALVADRTDQLLARNRRQGEVGVAMYIDLDDFKSINDTLGHEVGDRLLIAVAARLVATLRDADTIARTGGDEFVVLLDGSTAELDPELVAQRVLDVLRHPFAIDGVTTPLQINATIGIAVGDRCNGSELLRDADVALHHAKSTGKNRCQVFQPDMQTTLLRRVTLQSELRTAQGDDQFSVVYQPIYDLDDLTLIGVEALLRWRHPTLGNITPDEFVPILEQSGLVGAVGRWVLHEACQTAAEWNRSGCDIEISVNVSGRQLDDRAIIADIDDALEASGLGPRMLIIEVTETALMRNVAATAATLREIRALGIRIAIDDFGTGYSSLAYLQQLRVDSLKIDRQFIRAIGTSSESRALIKTLVQLGRDLGLTTLAEGVETTEELDHCRNEHVDQVQGFLLSRPLERADLETQILRLGARPIGR